MVPSLCAILALLALTQATSPCDEYSTSCKCEVGELVYANGPGDCTPFCQVGEDLLTCGKTKTFKKHSCKGHKGKCKKCKIGKPVWTGTDNCELNCIVGDMYLTCEQAQGFEGCEDQPAPCTCHAGKPFWTGHPGDCQFYCKVEDMLLDCEQSKTLQKPKCKDQPPPCKCKIGKPRWSGKPGNCAFGCVVDDMILTCKQANSSSSF